MRVLSSWFASVGELKLGWVKRTLHARRIRKP